MASSITCKIALNNEIRRFSCSVDTLTYTSIHQRAKDVMHIDAPFKLQYVDNEGDVITMSTDEEMAEAVVVARMKEPAVLRMAVKVEEQPSAKHSGRSKKEASGSNPAVPLDLVALVKNVEKALPGMLNDLSSTARLLLTDLTPRVYLKMKANESAKAASASEEKTTNGKAAKEKPGGVVSGHHPGVRCDKTGMSPIVGNRYHLIGHDYDLCEAEYIKLSPEEQAMFEKIPPPCVSDPRPEQKPVDKAADPRGRQGRCAGRGVGAQQTKLVSRLVSDVAVFDGTQVAPSTPFTKIWRIKNVGELPWPPGTMLLFVGGDQMSAALAVPLPRRVVLPGEEIDVAVDMVAPAEVGRYIGYWRLCTPGGRRFGQRVWCHIQVARPIPSAMLSSARGRLRIVLMPDLMLVLTAPCPWPGSRPRLVCGARCRL